MNEARLAVRRLYDFPDSGNGYKVRLALCQLGIPFEYAPVDILNGESRSDAFLARNPNGRIPLLELEDGSFLAESNAILFYLAEGTPLLPAERLARARALQWMCFEQYSHEPFIAVARFWLRHPEASDYRPDELAARQARGREALAVMERHLAGAAFFSSAHYGIADIALFESPEDFINKGAAFGVIENDSLKGIAYSSLVNSKAVEVSIYIVKKYRRLGMAIALGCALLKYCLEKNLHPNWDAANLESCRLAEKLGYTATETYDAFYLKPQEPGE